MTTTTNQNSVQVTDFIRHQLQTKLITTREVSKEVESTDGRVRLTYNETARIQLAQDSQNEATVSYTLEWVGFDENSDNDDDGQWVYPETVYITERHVAPANQVLVTDFIRRQLARGRFSIQLISEDAIDGSGGTLRVWKETARIRLTEESLDEVIVLYTIQWNGIIIKNQCHKGHLVYPQFVYVTKRHPEIAGSQIPNHQVKLHGYACDFDVLVNMMDDEIRELVHYEATKQEMSNQQFIDAYCKHHLQKHNKEFMI